MRERVERNRLRIRVLVEVRRSIIIAAFLGIVFVSLLSVGLLYPESMSSSLVSGDPIETLFQALIGATITGVTLVLTLNQLVLSQELGGIKDQRERMEGAMEFRRDAEKIFDAPVSPSDPASFLRALVDVTHDRTEELREMLDDNPDDELRDEVESLADSIEENADFVSDQLENLTFGTFDVISAALNFNYSRKIYDARRIRSEYSESLSEDEDEKMGSLIEALEMFGPAREHFKTLYFQWELINLSRVTLFSSIPALTTAVGMVIFYDASTITGSLVGVPVSVLLVIVGVCVSLLPFAVLLAYILRIATVTKRTLSIGPFVLRESRLSDDEWE
ncbi:MAG: hypothetical protein SV760_06850 [Halobacteria archaeon]|nr:hypothetical protein [Halobacteria archaeon]